jgi:PAS domain S-box-containing protein
VGPAEVYAAQLEAIIESVDEGLIICDAVGRMVRMNRQALKMLGCAGVEQAWRSMSDFGDLLELRTPEGVPIPSSDGPLSRAARGETFREVAIRSHNKRTGVDQTLRFSGTPVRSLDGDVILIVLTLRKVEESLDVLRQGDSRLTSVLRAAPMGIGLVANRVMLDVNDWFCEMVGYGRDELIGRSSRMLYPTQEDWEYVGRENYGQIDRQSKGTLETRWRRKDGRVIDVLLSSTLLDLENPSRGITFTALDITARKAAENELQDIFALSLDMICIADLRTNRFTKINPAFERILGYSEQELLSRPFTELVHPDDLNRVETVFKDKLRQGRNVVHFECRIRCKDGAYRWFDWTSQPQVEQGLTYAIARDVTEQKCMEHMLRFTQFAVDHTADAAFWMAEDGGFYYVNEAACRALGYSREELMRMTVFDIDPTFDKTLWLDTSREVEAKKSLVFETTHRTRDGRVFPVEIRANYVEYDGRKYNCAFARDITERKRAEEALRESEERFRTAFEAGAVAMALTAMDTTLLKVNSSFCRMLGFSESELVGRSYTETTHPDDVAANLAGTRRLADGEISSFRMEKRYIRKDGAVVWADMNTASVPDAHGRPLYCVTHIQDITERKQAEEALREKEYLLSESQRIGRIGSWRLDLASGVLTWTRETYRLYGVCPETFVPSSETLIELLHPDDREVMREWIRAALANERPGVLEFRVILEDGSVRILSGRGELIFADHDRPVRLLGTVQDVTEQKQAEAALRDLSRKDEEALRVARMGHWEYDMASGMFVFNDQYYTLHGTTAREAGGYRMAPEEFARRYVHPADAPLVGESVRRAVTTDDPDFQYTNEVRILRADGETRWVTVWFRIEKDARGRTTKLHGVNQDITERRDAEEALRRLNERLELEVAQRTEDLTHTVARLQQLTWELSQTEDRERKRIADILHDDVQQTLAAARFHLNLLDAGPRSAEESRELIHQVKQMLKEAIEKARSLSHELSPALYQIDLAETLKWLACHMRDQHGLIVHVEVHGQVELSSESAKALLYKVVQELLFNVVKHAGVKEALIRVRRMGPFICTAVIDRGAGFKPEDLEKTPGFGLLGIRERIQLLGGRMKIKSAPGRGCRLLIAIPDKA